MKNNKNSAVSRFGAACATPERRRGMNTPQHYLINHTMPIKFVKPLHIAIDAWMYGTKQRGIERYLIHKESSGVAGRPRFSSVAIGLFIWYDGIINLYI